MARRQELPEWGLIQDCGYSVDQPGEHRAPNLEPTKGAEAWTPDNSESGGVTDSVPPPTTHSRSKERQHAKRKDTCPCSPPTPHRQSGIAWVTRQPAESQTQAVQQAAHCDSLGIKTSLRGHLEGGWGHAAGWCLQSATCSGADKRSSSLPQSVHITINTSDSPKVTPRGHIGHEPCASANKPLLEHSAPNMTVKFPWTLKMKMWRHAEFVLIL